MGQTIYSLLGAAAARAPGAPALLGVGRKPLNYNGLLQLIDRTVKDLNSIGIGKGDRVAIVLPNGPDAAACCLSVASGATSAPLNPGGTSTEFQSYFSRLKPQAVIVGDHSESACIEVAEGMGIPVIRLISDPAEPAGVFQLNGAHRKPAANPGFATQGDVALLMHTSGSTSLPKAAPLTHLNVCSGGTNNVRQLMLTADDRCLCITGLFFTQGILVSVFSSLIAGGSVVCTPGFDPVRFFEWLDEFHPTWYAAPVAMQRSILSRADRYPEIVSRSRLRVIRSSSSPASPDFIGKMETLFRAPMLDSYGLTETGSTIVGERLPPAARKRGSVGVALGCEIAILDERGTVLAADQVGEVVVRGPSVVAAYDGGAEVNGKSFINGWLRTGDLGKLDHSGYLYLTGRIKEFINRGGEKISPIEIDEVLSSHPAVAEAIAFALPDERLGEEVGAAVVLRDGLRPSIQLETEMQEFAGSRLAGFRVPRRILFVDEIPKAPTGKALRIGLAEKLGLKAPAALNPAGLPTAKPAAPRSREHGDSPQGIVEMLLLHIWEDMLSRSPIGIHDDFFDLGGDSLLGTRLLARIEKAFQKRLTLASFFEAPTVARMASLLTATPSKGYVFEGSKVINIRSSGNLPPLFMLGLNPLFRPLILGLPEDLPVYGLTFPNPTSLPQPFRIEDIATDQVNGLRRFRPQGPYALAGWCADGILAYEMAQQLRAQGQEVTVVAMIDSFNPARWSYESRWNSRRDRLQFHLAKLSSMNFKSAWAYGRERLTQVTRKIRRGLWRALYRLHSATRRPIGVRLQIPEQILNLAVNRYVPRPYDGRVLVVRAETRPSGTHADAAYGWRGIASDLRVVDVPGNHRDIFVEPYVHTLALAVADVLRDLAQHATGQLER